MNQSKETTIVSRIAAVLVFFFITGTAFGFFLRSITDDYLDEPEIIVHETYTVKPGDTFWNIAEEFRALDARNPYILQYMEELRDANPNLRSNHSQVRAGDELTITYYRKN